MLQDGREISAKFYKRLSHVIKKFHSSTGREKQKLIGKLTLHV